MIDSTSPDNVTASRTGSIRVISPLLWIVLTLSTRGDSKRYASRVSTAARRRPSNHRTYDNTSREAEARVRRRAVIDAAADLFLSHGYGETTIAAVAAAAEVSPQLVYATFGGKAGLLSAVVDVLVGGDDEPVLLRDRPDFVALAKVRSKRELAHAAARVSTDLNTRVGPMLHLIDSVAGSDAAVAELRDKLVAFQREDCRRFAADYRRFIRADLDLEQAGEIIRTVGGHQVWQSLVMDGGWSTESYEQWLADTY